MVVWWFSSHLYPCISIDLTFGFCLRSSAGELRCIRRLLSFDLSSLSIFGVMVASLLHLGVEDP